MHGIALFLQHPLTRTPFCRATPPFFFFHFRTGRAALYAGSKVLLTSFLDCASR